MRLPLLVVALLLSCSACDGDPAGAGEQNSRGASGTPVVLTTFYPTAFFAERIAGDLVDVRCPLPSDADSITWKPSAEDIAAYQAADLVITNGARLEKWVGQVSLPSSRIVRTAAGFRSQWIRVVETTHSHGPGGEHSHFGHDGHTWMDPQLAILQSRAITDALIRLRKERASDFEAGFARLEEELQGLHSGFEALGALPAGEVLYASHPTYNYLARRYGWRVVNFDLDPRSMPTESTLSELEQRLRKDRGRYMLWEREPEPAIAEALRKLGLESLVISPCEVTPAQGADAYLATMRASIARLAAAFD